MLNELIDEFDVLYAQAEMAARDALPGGYTRYAPERDFSVATERKETVQFTSVELGARVRADATPNAQYAVPVSDPRLASAYDAEQGTTFTKSTGADNATNQVNAAVRNAGAVSRGMGILGSTYAAAERDTIVRDNPTASTLAFAVRLYSFYMGAQMGFIARPLATLPEIYVVPRDSFLYDDNFQGNVMSAISGCGSNISGLAATVMYCSGPGTYRQYAPDGSSMFAGSRWHHPGGSSRITIMAELNSPTIPVGASALTLPIIGASLSTFARIFGPRIMETARREAVALATVYPPLSIDDQIDGYLNGAEAARSGNLVRITGGTTIRRRPAPHYGLDGGGDGDGPDGGRGRIRPDPDGDGTEDIVPPDFVFPDLPGAGRRPPRRLNPPGIDPGTWARPSLDNCSSSGQTAYSPNLNTLMSSLEPAGTDMDRPEFDDTGTFHYRVRLPPDDGADADAEPQFEWRDWSLANDPRPAGLTDRYFESLCLFYLPQSTEPELPPEDIFGQAIQNVFGMLDYETDLFAPYLRVDTVCAVLMGALRPTRQDSMVLHLQPTGENLAREGAALHFDFAAGVLLRGLTPASFDGVWDRQTTLRVPGSGRPILCAPNATIDSWPFDNFVTREIAASVGPHTNSTALGGFAVGGSWTFDVGRCEILPPQSTGEVFALECAVRRRCHFAAMAPGLGAALATYFLQVGRTTKGAVAWCGPTANLYTPVSVPILLPNAFGQSVRSMLVVNTARESELSLGSNVVTADRCDGMSSR